jgi:uncharacterized protein YjbI with pentapeptide repeats
MANEEHLAILKQGVEVWNKWREENKHIRPDLSGAKLSGAKLRGADLNRAKLWEADLFGTDLSGADLSYADLGGSGLAHADLIEADLFRAYLGGADLSGANLSGANLSGAVLVGANLIRVNLSGVNLSEVDLSGVNLFGVNLSGVNLFRANLSRAVLTWSDLSQANFDNVLFDSTIFGNLDLSVAKNLHLARHDAPSTIDIDTLYKSSGNIPEIFLRGCGVPDTMIAFAKSLVGKAIDFYSCFISYSTADEAFAQLLYDTLQGQGIRCWFAPEQILPGERIDSAIDYGIRYWDKVIFCASKSSLTEKWWVDFEVDKAFKKARDLQRERGLPIDVLIPLNLDGYLFSSEYEKNPKRSIFETILAADFVGWESDIAKFNREVKKVIRAIQTDGGKEEPPPSKL